MTTVERKLGGKSVYLSITLHFLIYLDRKHISQGGRLSLMVVVGLIKENQPLLIVGVFSNGDN